jgi:hypothetical protein
MIAVYSKNHLKTRKHTAGKMDSYRMTKQVVHVLTIRVKSAATNYKHVPTIKNELWLFYNVEYYHKTARSDD